MNEQWVAVAEDRWELRGANGARLGSLVRLSPSDESAAATWAGLPRGGVYLQPQTQLRAAADMLLERVRDRAPAVER